MSHLLTQWIHYLHLFLFSLNKKKNGGVVVGGLAKSFECQRFTLFCNLRSCSLMDLHVIYTFTHTHTELEYHCKVCPPSPLLRPYCPLALCAGAFVPACLLWLNGSRGGWAWVEPPPAVEECSRLWDMRHHCLKTIMCIISSHFF